MVEIRMRNTRLRSGINIALATLFVVLLVYLLISHASKGFEVRRIESQVEILEQDVTKKQQEYTGLLAKLEYERKNLTAQQMVQRSMELQELRKSLSGSQEQLTERRERLDGLTGERRRAVYAMIFATVGFLLILWVHYIINY